MKAFTLVETLVVISIFGLIIVAISSTVLFLYKSQNFSWQQALAIDEARRGIKIMSREIRGAVTGDDGSFPIEEAENKEFIFYSDIDQDGAVERIRYFLGGVSSGSQVQECVTYSDGGSCSVNFSNFLQGDLQNAQIQVSVEGDFGNATEYANLYADNHFLGSICVSGCVDCHGNWQGNTTFNITEYAQDGQLSLEMDASSSVDNICNWSENNHSMKARFELSWSENIEGMDHQLKKGIVSPTGNPAVYNLDQEEVQIVSSYVRNSPPIFEYFDESGNIIEEELARLVDTRIMKIYLVINIDPTKAPNDFVLETYLQLRNLK